MSAFEAEKHALEEAIRAAGALTVKMRGEGLQVRYKKDDDPVTSADLQANRLLRERLLGAFPHYGWLSEEDHDDLQRLNQPIIWLVDPIDGTRSFADGTAEYSISVALIQNGQAVLGCVYNPITDELFSGVAGQGVTRNGHPVQTRPRYQAPPLLLASRTEIEQGEWHIFEPVTQIRPISSVAYKLALLAAGEGDAVFSRRKKCEWDIVAGVMLVLEAGGVVTDRRGYPFRFNQPDVWQYHGILAASAPAYDPINRLITETIGNYSEN